MADTASAKGKIREAVPLEPYSDDFSQLVLWFPWILAAFLVIVSGIMMFSKFWLLLWTFWVPLLFFLMFRFVTVESTEPPTIAILKVWQKLCKKILNPSFYLTLPFFPFRMRITLIVRKYQERTFKFIDIPCRLPDDLDEEDAADSPERPGRSPKAGGSFDLELSLAFEPDPERPVFYLVAGGEEASDVNDRLDTKTVLHDILFNNIVQAVQDFATERTWEEMVFISRYILAVYLVESLSGVILKDRKGIQIVVDPLDPEVLNLRSELAKRCEWALKKALLGNNVITIPSWGLMIRQFKIGPIRPPKPLREAAEAVATERKKREQEMIELGTLRRIANGYVEDSKDSDGKPTMSFKEALEVARVQKEISTERFERIIIEAAASTTPIERAGAMAGRKVS